MRSLDLRICLCLTLVASSAWLEARPKQDILYLKNGDRMTVEIKTLEQGQLTVKTEYTIGTFVIDWREVERVESPQRFEIETREGVILTGFLEQAPGESAFGIRSDSGSLKVTRTELVRLAQDQERALERLKLKVDYGFSLTKANSKVNSSLEVSADYITPRWHASNDSSLSFSGQADGTDTSRSGINNSILRRLPWEHWYAAGLANFLSNSEQQLDLRSTLGGALGRYLLHTNSALVSVFAGSTYSREKYAPQLNQPATDNAELLFGLTGSWYRFDAVDFDYSTFVHPSLTNPGRVRIDLNSGLSLTMLGDNLYWKVSFYDNFDSRPPSGASRNDAGVSTSIGWWIF